ncbi:MAG TPA: PGPGW domain-containing protein [Sphingomicrobium sp.]
MSSRDRFRRFFDQPWVEWGLLVLGVVLIIIGIIVSPLPGPGGVFFIAPGAALVLRTSMWAKRRYVKFKRWQPKAGRYADWALRRQSAKRREQLRKSQEQQQQEQRSGVAGPGTGS